MIMLAWFAKKSDRLAANLIPDAGQLSLFQSYKGALFVAASALVMFLLLRYALRVPRRAGAAMQLSAAAGANLAVVTQLVLLVLVVALPLCSLLAWIHLS